MMCINAFVKRAALPALLCALLLASTLAAVAAERNEVQRHGYIFEKWVRDTFFQGYEAQRYTSKWDVAKEANVHYGNIPVSIKTAKYGSSVELGDALRQFDTDEEFLIIIGFWNQEGKQKRIVNVVAARIEPQQWKSLWQPIGREDLLQLDALIKNRARDATEVRAEAQKKKRRAPFSKAVMQVNPKIDSRTQRRLQCSLRFADVFEYLAPKADPMPQKEPQLFGREVLLSFESAPRN